MADLPLNKLAKFIRKQVGVGAKRALTRASIVAMKAAEGAYRRRIFNKGLDATGRKIGKYSTKPILIGSSSFRTKSIGKKVFSSKKKRRALSWVKVKGNNLAILPGGYKEIRRISGNQTAFVDMQFRGDLFKGIGVGKTLSGEPALGFFNDLSRKKAEGNETRFKKDIFGLSGTELRVIDRAFARELDKFFKSLQ